MITNRKKYKFKYFDKFIEVQDITVWQYVRFLEGDETVMGELFWQDAQLMCKRQLENALKILLGWYEANELKERLWSNKAVSWDKIDPEHFFILEWKMMLALHQSRTEIRSWEYLYFAKMNSWMWVITWGESYDDFKNWHKPDKKWINNALSTKK